MVRAHRQAWAWQDEWNGLTMEDIREIERQTQLALQRKMGMADAEDELEDGEKASPTATTTTMTSITTATTTPANATMTSEESAVAKTLAATLGSIEKNEEAQSPLSVKKPSDIPIINTAASSEGEISPEDSPLDVNETK